MLSGVIVHRWKITVYMGGNSTQNITETQNTQNGKQKTQKEKANIKGVIKEHKNN
jgi:hypothetical protein